jgi:hypothetical protein
MAKRKNDADSAAAAIILVAAIAIISLGISFVAKILYLPFKKQPNDPGKILGVLGIGAILVGAGLLAYQILPATAEDSLPSRTSWTGWLPLFSGLAIYLFALSLSRDYQMRVLGMRREVQALAADGRLTAEAAECIGRDRALPTSAWQAALYDARQVQTLAAIEQGRLPTSLPPDGIFLNQGEYCHASFTSVVLYEDVVGTQHSVAGGAVYWRVADGITLRPSTYSAKSMPVAELKQRDSGLLVVTSQRVIFQGETCHLDFLMSKIEGLSHYADGFQIQTAGKSKRQIFSLSSVDVRLVTALITKLVVGH